MIFFLKFDSERVSCEERFQLFKHETFKSVNLAYCNCILLSQPQTKKINQRTVVNAAGDNVQVVGVVLNEGVSNLSSTELEFTVNIPKTGFFNFILRYMVSSSLSLFVQ